MDSELPKDKSTDGATPHNPGDERIINLNSPVGLDAEPTPKIEDLGHDDQKVPAHSHKRRRGVRLRVVYTGGSLLFRLVAAVIATLLAAGLLTIEWDGYQKEAELRARLVQDITTSVARAKVSAHFIAAGVYGIEARGKQVNVARIKQQYNKRKWDWESDAARISAQLGAYFRNPEVGQDWQDFWDAMSDYFELSYPGPEKGDAAQGRGDLKSRAELVKRIASYLEKRRGKKAVGPVMRQRLVNRSGGQLASYYQDYRDLGRKLLPEQNNLNKDVLEKPTEIGPPIGLVRTVRWLRAKIEKLTTRRADRRPT